MKINTILVDDELNAIRTLEVLIHQNCPQLNIVAHAMSVEEAILLINKHEPDLVFMDIEMPTGSGFKVVDHTKHIDYKLIFTTAYHQYAIQAFKVNAIDYLLKPTQETDLVNAVGKVLKQESAPINFETLRQLIRSPYERPKISFHSNDGFISVYIHEIVRIESDANYTWVHFTGKPKLLVSKSLKDLENQLKDHHFIRVHNSHLINRQLVAKYTKLDGGYLILEDNSKVPVSRRKRPEILHLFSSEF